MGEKGKTDAMVANKCHQHGTCLRLRCKPHVLVGGAFLVLVVNLVEARLCSARLETVSDVRDVRYAVSVHVA